MKYEELLLKIPVENENYARDSRVVLSSIKEILKSRIEDDRHKIILNTNLRYGLPLENINKIAGPIIEAWCFEVFSDIRDDTQNKYQLINVEAQQRLNMADIVLQFKKGELHITGNVDVKATAENIEGAGKGPNITSFSRIRTAYVDDPDYLFVILSIKYRVYSAKNETTSLFDGIMEISGYNAYDLKFISENDLNYNPALGTGQIQIKDIHYIDVVSRTTWEFCQLLDKKYLNSSRRSLEHWLREARKNGWIKE